MGALSQILQDQMYKYYANTFSNEYHFFKAFVMESGTKTSV